MSEHGKIDYEKVFNDYPHLRELFDPLIRLVISTDIENAHDAEEVVIKDTRKLGKEILNSWAASKADEKAKDVRLNQKDAKGHGKKNSTGTQHSEK
jgi:hypothetical protein